MVICGACDRDQQTRRLAVHEQLSKERLRHVNWRVSLSKA